MLLEERDEVGGGGDTWMWREPQAELAVPGTKIPAAPREVDTGLRCYALRKGVPYQTRRLD